MSFVTKSPISIPILKDFTEVLIVSNKEHSLHFVIGYSILSSIIRLKACPEYLKVFREKLYAKINSLDPYVTHFNLNTAFQRYKDILRHLENNPNRNECVSWLNAWISNEESFISIYQAGYIIFYESAYSLGLNLDMSDSVQLMKLFSQISESLSVCIKIIWQESSYCYSPPNNSWGVYFNIYYFSENSYGALIHNLEKIFDANSDSQIDIRQEPFLYIPKPPEASKQPEPVTQIKLIERSQVVHEPIQVNPQSKEIFNPALAHFMTIMSNVIIKQNIYSPEILEALEEAAKINKEILDIKGLKELLQLKEPICLEHHMPVSKLMNCKKKHCQDCIFKIIKEEFTPENFRVCCPCGVQIAPKDIEIMKKTNGYQVFKKKYQKNN
ncbi:hypothetical protein SteCoe_20726 [Stentor coeruleus]|uniref:Uncharacterized protein n=1 Tax=Stentor coeruleus TaxID=5963 RepID=A0A1R2BR84_9CILI|nr:hypothetical protein SteCoe_20726 [Stentor coeruleus]